MASPRSLMDGFQLPLEGGRLLLRERRLWAPAAAPIGFSLLAFAAAISLLVAYAGGLYEWVTLWVPSLEATSWYAWLWVGPAKALLAILGAVIFAVVAGVVLLVSFLLANVLASPFLDVLASRVEWIETGVVEEDAPTGLIGTGADALRSLREELRRALFFLAVVAGLALAGFVIPGAHLVTGPSILAFSIFFLPLDYASYTLDRRRYSFRQKRTWLMANKPVVAGFGCAAFLICWVPGLNFLAIPLLVVGGTLLAIRHAPVRPGA
ncbi:MAG: EI24 domain-containing protein [Deltaproteobacteria bacterium]|jgi:CysZ protein|nr:EI24 domain-containing protein [Deltaproteobacteria bacterium]MBW2543342.1 EI24 domain-containing protein [Deltaproteobacteria bacterium]